MSKIIPFEALLPNPDHAASVISPPYDIISSDEARAFAKDNPYSFLHITKAEIDLSVDIAPYSSAVYEKGAENFLNFLESGRLFRDRSSFYIYRLAAGSHIQTGLVCGVSTDEYEAGFIKRHELTREVKVIDRARLSERVGAHLEPVFLVHRSSKAVTALLADEAKAAPLYDLADRGGVRHILWRAAGENEIKRLFSKMPALYIADGHHRSEAAFRLRYKSAYFPAVIFPEEEVKVFEYNWSGEPAKRPLSKYTIKDIMKYADKGEILPPKSTWFAPKLVSGLFLKQF